MNCESMYIYYDGQLNDCSSTCIFMICEITGKFEAEPRIQHTCTFLYYSVK